MTVSLYLYVSLLELFIADEKVVMNRDTKSNIYGEKSIWVIQNVFSRIYIFLLKKQ